MKILVCIKQVPDTESKIRLTADGSLDTNGIKWVMNPYDEIAVEEALKLKQANAGSIVKIISLGPKKRIVDAIRTGLAMGADEGVAIDGPEDLDFFATAKALANYIKNEESDFGMVFTGKLAIDDNNASVSQALAEFLDTPHTTVVSKFTQEGDSCTVEREVEGGSREIVQLTGPAVVGANKGLNTPRYASLPGIMKAKKKPMKNVEATSLGITDSDRKLRYTSFQLPAEKPAVKMIDGEAPSQAKELTRLLREEAKII